MKNRPESVVGCFRLGRKNPVADPTDGERKCGAHRYDRCWRRCADISWQRQEPSTHKRQDHIDRRWRGRSFSLSLFWMALKRRAAGQKIFLYIRWASFSFFFFSFSFSFLKQKEETKQKPQKHKRKRNDCMMKEIASIEQQQIEWLEKGRWKKSKKKIYICIYIDK